MEWHDRMWFSSLWRPENGKVLRQTVFFLEICNIGRHAMGMNHDVGEDLEGKGQRENFVIVSLNTRVRGRRGKASVKEDS